MTCKPRVLPAPLDKVASLSIQIPSLFLHLVLLIVPFIRPNCSLPKEKGELEGERSAALTGYGVCKIQTNPVHLPNPTPSAKCSLAQGMRCRDWLSILSTTIEGKGEWRRGGMKIFRVIWPSHASTTKLQEAQSCDMRMWGVSYHTCVWSNCDCISVTRWLHLRVGLIQNV